MSRDTIKYIAMLTMLINHIANVFLPAGMWYTNLCLYIGYFTAVTMCYFLVEGYGYTRTKRKYAGRLLGFAVPILTAGFVILYLYDGQRARRGRSFSKWFFYTFYPAHLLVLGLIRILA